MTAIDPKFGFAAGSIDRNAVLDIPSRSRRRNCRQALTLDEKSALCLLAMARDLLAADHRAIAAMLDYAMFEIEAKSARPG